MQDEQKIRLAMKYLVILQSGRIKPDKHQNNEHGVIWDSLDNIGEIRAIKKFINKKLGVDES